MKKNINLKSEYEASKKNKHKSPLSSIFSVIIILLALIAYGAVYFLNSQAKEEVSNLENRTKEVRKKLESEEIKNFYDFENKKNFIQQEIEKFGYNRTASALVKISENTFSEIEVVGLSLSKESDYLGCQIEIRTPVKDQIAKQLKAYNDADQIEGVETGGVQLQEGYYHAKVSFNLY
jgi:flagellar basal body-associated protein FliL